jgi:hypothetical protein
VIEYIKDGMYHRANGPAMWHRNGGCWWLNDKPHRYYGARSSYIVEWWIHGEMIK